MNEDSNRIVFPEVEEISGSPLASNFNLRHPIIPVSQSFYPTPHPTVLHFDSPSRTTDTAHCAKPIHQLTTTTYYTPVVSRERSSQILGHTHPYPRQGIISEYYHDNLVQNKHDQPTFLPNTHHFN